MRPSPSRCIFHIEDDEDDRLMLKEAVVQIDPSLQVLSAENGQDGLDVLIQFALLDTLPALIILDLNLPGIDGKRALTEIKKHPVLSAIPIAVFTTSSSELDKLFLEKEGVRMYTKPSSEAEFFKAVQHILETHYRAAE